MNALEGLRWMCSRRLAKVPLSNSWVFQVLLGYLGSSCVSASDTSLDSWYSCLLVGNATLGNHSTSNALNATMNGSVNSLAVLSMHLVVEQQRSTWKSKRACWRCFHPCFPFLSRLEPVKLEVSANASPCSENWCWFLQITLQWLISCKADVWQASSTGPSIRPY